MGWMRGQARTDNTQNRPRRVGYKLLSHSLSLSILSLFIITLFPGSAMAVTKWVDVAGGVQHGIAVKEDGTLWAWGRNTFGQQGNGTTTDTRVPVRSGTGRNWDQVDAAWYHSAGLYNGSAYVWGRGEYGKIGNGAETDQLTPFRIIIGSETFQDIATGQNQTSVVTNSGKLYSMGLNSQGAIAQGSYTPDRYLTPTRESTSGTDWFGVGSGNGSAFMMGLKNSGVLWGWGNNQLGQLGVGSTSNNKNVVTRGKSVSGCPNLDGSGMYVDVESGQYFSVGLLSNGILCLMGDDSSGQLGNGVGEADTTQPQRLSTTAYSSIAAGQKHVLAVRSNGTLWAWGYNAKGQLGVGGTAIREVPTQVGTDTDWATVGAGYNMSFGIKTNGSLWAWGENTSYGYLGIGSLTSIRTTPTQIDGISTTATTNPSSGAGSGSWYLSPPTVTLTADQPGTTQYQWNGTAEDGWSNYSGTLSTSEGQNNLSYRSIDGFGVTENAKTRKVWVDLGNPTVPTGVVSTTHSTTDAIQDDLIAVQWTAATDGVSGVDGYDYSFTNGATDEPDGVKDEEQGVTAITSDALSGGGWYFHVRAIDNAGRKGLTTHAGPFQITPNFTQVSGGGRGAGNISHTLAVKDDGTLWAWGSNNFGQLGDGTTADATRPKQIGSDTDWIQASAGDYFSLGLNSDGEVWAWGRNSKGQLGDGTTTPSLTPVQVLGIGGAGYMTTAVQVAAGSNHGLARLLDGTIGAWGANTKGQLGNGNFNDDATPDSVVITSGILTLATDIDAAGDHSVALRSPGALWAWGNNAFGQLGDGTITLSRNRGYQESRRWTNWTGVAAGRAHTIGRLSNGFVYAFGRNNKGQLGDGTNTDRNIATAPSGTGFSAAGVAAGNEHSLVTQNDGTIRAFGSGANGQLGRSTGSTADANKFVEVGGAMTTFLTADAGAEYSIAIKDDNSVWVWGDNAAGQLGDDTTTDRTSPLQISGAQYTTFSTMASVPNGNNGWFKSGPNVYLSAAAPGVTQYQIDATADGSWATYGSSFRAPEGIHTIYYRSTDTLGGMTEDIQSQVVKLDTVDPTDPAVYSSSHTTEDTSFDNTIDVTWDGAADLTSGVDGFSFSYTQDVTEVPDAGKDAEETVTSDTSGTLAPGDWYFNLRTLDNAGNWTSTVHIGPFTIESRWAQIEVGYRHTLAIKEDGTLWAWGYNRNGQLGDGTTDDSQVPVQIGAETNWTDIAVGLEHSMGLQSTGRLYGWGRNTKGQIGNASTTEQHSPVQVYGSWNTWSEVEAGVRHTIARRGGWLYGWGDNYQGQLGAGGADSFSHTRPLRESLNDTDWTAIGTGDYTSFGIKDAGRLYAWGYNKEGQLGVGNSGVGTNRSAPTLVKGNYTDWVEVDGGKQHTVGRRSSGNTFAWGKNTYGQIGNNTTADALTSPVWVKLLGTATDIEVGSGFTLARRPDGGIYTWGLNTRGQLGHGDTDVRLRPIQVGTDLDWDIIAAGDQSAIAVKTSGEAWVWGYNRYGMLGNGSDVNSSSPILMNGIKTTVSVSPSSPDGLNGWYSSIPQVTLSTSVPGASKYSWDTDIAEWFDYSAPFGANLGQRTLTYYSFDGTTDVEDNTDMVIKTDPYRPSSPALSVTSTSSSHDLTWTSASDSESSVTEYRIYDIDGTELVTIDASSYSFNGLTSDVTRRYYIKAQDMAGNLSDESATVTGATAGGVDVTSPTAPGLAAFTDDPLTVYLKIRSSQDDVGVTGYKVRELNSGTFIADFAGGALTVTQDGLGGPLSDQQYYGYVVFAYDAAGNISPPSNKVRIRPTNGSDGYEDTPAGSGEEAVTVMPGKKADFPEGSPAVTFKDVTKTGSTQVKRVEKAQESPKPSGFRIVGGQIDISTTAKFRDKVTVAFRYDENSIMVSEVNLKLLHYHNNKWTDITTFVDTRNNVIYGEASEFSHFGVGFPDLGHEATGNSSVILFFGVIALIVGVGAVRRTRRSA